MAIGSKGMQRFIMGIPDSGTPGGAFIMQVRRIEHADRVLVEAHDADNGPDLGKIRKPNHRSGSRRQRRPRK